MNGVAKILWLLLVAGAFSARVALGYIRACLREEDPKYVPPNQLPAFFIGVKSFDLAPVVHFRNLRRWRGRTARAASVYSLAVAAAFIAAVGLLILKSEMEP